MRPTFTIQFEEDTYPEKYPHLMLICRIQVSCSKTQFQNPGRFCVFGFVDNLSKSAFIGSENEYVKVY